MEQEAQPGVLPEREATAVMPQDEPGEPAARWRLASPVVQHLAAFTAYLALWLALGAFPLLAHPASAQLRQAIPDPNFFVWALRWWPYAIAHGLDPLHSTQVAAPGGADLAWTTLIPLLALLLSPVTLLAGPVVSFNLLAVVSLPLSGWGAFALGRRITGRFWPALAGGAIYGFSGYEASHMSAGQLNLAFSPIFPLLAYLAVMRLEGKITPRVFTGLFALGMTAQFYLFIETFADMTVVLVVSLLAGYVVIGRAGRPAVARLAKMTGIAYLLTLAAALPYLWAVLSHPRASIRSPARTSVDLMGLVITGYGKVFKLSWLFPHRALRPATDMASYIGIPLLVLVVLLAVLCWSRKIVRFLTVVFGFVVVAALGPVLRVNGRRVHGLLWKRLWYLPIVRDAFPVRLLVFGFLALAVMTAIWLAGPSMRRWPRWLLAILAIGTIVANVPALNIRPGPGLPPFITSGAYKHYLAKGATVVVVSAQTANAGLLWQADTDFYMRLAGGYLNQAGGNSAAVPRPVADLVATPQTQADIAQFLSFMKSSHVSAILVQAGASPRWRIVLGRLHMRGLTVGGVTIYRAA